MPKKYTGHCTCGAVTFEFDTDPHLHQALAVNFPEPGLFPMRCQLTLGSSLPPVRRRASDGQHNDERLGIRHRDRTRGLHPGLDHYDPIVERFP